MGLGSGRRGSRLVGVARETARLRSAGFSRMVGTLCLCHQIQNVQSVLHLTVTHCKLHPCLLSSRNCCLESSQEPPKQLSFFFCATLINPFPTLVVTVTTRILWAIPTAPVAPVRRSKAHRGEVWVLSRGPQASLSLTWPVSTINQRARWPLPGGWSEIHGRACQERVRAEGSCHQSHTGS